MTSPKFKKGKKLSEGIREKNEKLILAAGEQIFAECGYGGARTNDIAKRANIPKANLYYYFPTKMDLYRTIIKDTCIPWLRAIDFNNDIEPRDAIETYVREKMRLSRERPLGSKIFAMEIMNGAPQLQTFLETELKDWFTDVRKSFDEWKKAGKIADVDTLTFFFMIWATTQHYADFSHQINVLNNGRDLSDKQFETSTNEVCRIVLGAAGLK